MKNNINMKKRIIIILCVSIIIGIVALVYHVINVNIMHRIYRSTLLGYKLINEVPALRSVSYEQMAEFENFGGLSIRYKKEILKENVKVQLFFPRDEELLKVRTNIQLSDTISLNFSLSYDYQKEVITYEPIEIAEGFVGEEFGTHYWDEENINRCLKECNVTREDIEKYQEYALYEVVMKTWLEAHGGSYERAYKRMKKTPLIDNTFAFSDGKEPERE